jgi:hypothetical protein
VTITVTNISSPFNNENNASDEPDRVLNLKLYGPKTTHPVSKKPTYKMTVQTMNLKIGGIDRFIVTIKI